MCICALVYAYLDLDPTSLEFCFCLHFILSLSTFISMPPKYTRKQTESRDIDVGHESRRSLRTRLVLYLLLLASPSLLTTWSVFCRLINNLWLLS